MRMTILRALLSGVTIVLSAVIFTALYSILSIMIIRRSGNVSYGVLAAAAMTVGSPLFWLLLVVLVSGISRLFTRHC